MPGSQWKAKDWVGLKAPAGWLAWLGGGSRCKRGGVSSAAPGGPDAPGPAQGPKNLLNPGSKAAASAWMVDRVWADVPLSVLALHARFFSLLQPPAFPVLRQRYGWWAKEMSIALAPEAFSRLTPCSSSVSLLPLGADSFSSLALSFRWLSALSGGTGSQCSALPLGVAVSLR